MSSFNKNYTAGDVISIAFFKHEDDPNGEPRWIICVEDLQDEIIAVPLKSTINHQIHQPNSIIIDSESEEGKRMGLKNTSLIAPNRARQIHKPEGIKRGSCSEGFLDKILELI